MSRLTVVVPALALIAAALSACSDSLPAAQSYSGTVLQGSSTVTTIAVAAAGTLTVTLTNVAPAPSIGLGIGQPSGSACTPTLASSPAATVGTTVSAPVTAGTYCVTAYDTGTVAGTTDYSFTVTHP